MKNADMPAMPSDVNAVYEAMTDSDDSWGKAALGLTKREMMAMHMMCAMIGAPVGRVNIDDGEQLPLMAIAAADALLAELERTK